jgi:O-glycosyl hydrolase
MKTNTIRLAVLWTLMSPLLAADVSLTIDKAAGRQAIEGFGTCIITWGKNASEAYYTDEAARIYVEELGLNMLRVNVAVLPENIIRTVEGGITGRYEAG